MVYYYFICQKKLWYFMNEINMEQNSELVSIGKILDETTYSREKKGILIDNTINIDFIKNGAILHEIKKTKAIEEAGIWQIKYYMYYLEKRGVKNIQAKIDYPLIRESKEIILEDDDRNVLDNIEKNILDLKQMDNPPKLINEKICKKCAYYDLCYV
ncbi:MAG: CRISPR-associated protein Cas4 [Clostridia bacterium]|nr:CRISPR-associated protein Cas4 [Clostridia bacterium]